jgi:hypothetical protein
MKRASNNFTTQGTRKGRQINPKVSRMKKLIKIRAKINKIETLVSFVKFIPKYFIFYSFSACSLLLYRTATDFCILVLYPATLPKDFMISKFFGGVFRVF